MVYKREFYTKDKEIQRYMENLMNNGHVRLPPQRAKDISRNPTIRKIRNMDKTNPYILISADQKFHMSMIDLRKPMKIIKIGDRYIFSF